MSLGLIERPVAPDPAAKGKTHLRRDVQGMRALAVGLVILDHLFGWPAGGYIGVDVFFVISGFVITSKLVRERERDGRISFRDFYAGRLRRLMPAAITVLVVTNVAAYLLFTGVRRTQTLTDSVWALLFGANWRFASLGTDYFNDERPPSPFQHYWSLAVEEQFYVVWPALIVLVFLLRRRIRGSVGNAALLPVVLLAVIAGSFAWSALSTLENPAVAYFSTLTRAWELAVGAFAVLIVTWASTRPVWLRIFLSWAGMIGILGAAIGYGTDTLFPGTAAALPVMATMLLLLAGESKWSPSGDWMLSSRPFLLVGDWSYSLYLWHWPVIVLAASIYPDDSLTFYLTVITAGAVLSIASFYLIERPVRESSWLMRAEQKNKHERAHELRVKPSDLLLAAAALVTVPVAALLLLAPDTLRSAPPVTAPVAASSTTGEDGAPLTLEEQLRAEISGSIAPAGWPELNPRLDQLEDAGSPEWLEDNCIDVTDANRERCTYGPADATKNAAVVGDSYAISLVPGIREALESEGYRVHVLTLGQCGADEVPVTRNGVPYIQCEEHRAFRERELAELRPDLLVMSSSLRMVGLAVDQNDVYGQVERGLAAAYERLSPHAGRTIVISPPPGAGNLQECVTALSEPVDCTAPVGGGWTRFVAAEKKGAEAAGVKYLDLLPWFCVSGRCPAVIGSMPAYYEGAHLTAAYARRLAPLLKPHLLGDATAS